MNKQFCEIFAVIILGISCGNAHADGPDTNSTITPTKDNLAISDSNQRSNSPPAKVNQTVHSPDQETQQETKRRIKALGEAAKVELMIKESASGNEFAQFDLGIRFLTGDGVQKDLGKAVFLLDRAATQGHPEAKEKLKEALRSHVPAQTMPTNLLGKADLEELQTQIDGLKKENQELRKQLESVRKASDADAISRLSAPTPSLTTNLLQESNSISVVKNPRGSVSPSSKEPKWSISTGGKRHNQRCRYFSTGKPCGRSDGVACGTCGG